MPEANAECTVRSALRPLGSVSYAGRRRVSPLHLAAGSLFMRVCGLTPKDCKNTRCRLRPLCECAVEEYGRAKKLENRVWVVLGVCGAIGVVWWVVTGLLPMFA